MYTLFNRSDKKQSTILVCRLKMISQILNSWPKYEAYEKNLCNEDLSILDKLSLKGFTIKTIQLNYRIIITQAITNQA